MGARYGADEGGRLGRLKAGLGHRAHVQSSYPSEDGVARWRGQPFGRTAQADPAHHFFLLGAHFGEIDVANDFGDQLFELRVDTASTTRRAAWTCKQ